MTDTQITFRQLDKPSGGNAGQRPTAPMGGRFSPTRGRALSLWLMAWVEI